MVVGKAIPRTATKAAARPGRHAVTRRVTDADARLETSLAPPVRRAAPSPQHPRATGRTAQAVRRTVAKPATRAAKRPVPRPKAKARIGGFGMLALSVVFLGCGVFAGVGVQGLLSRTLGPNQAVAASAPVQVSSSFTF